MQWFIKNYLVGPCRWLWRGRQLLVINEFILSPWHWAEFLSWMNLCNLHNPATDISILQTTI